MDGRYAGVDVGGTKTAILTLDRGRFSAPHVEETERRDQEHLVARLAELLEERGPFDAVGIGLPGVIDPRRGIVRGVANLPLDDSPLADALAERVGAPVHLENDAAVAALAEAFDDSLRLTAELLVMFTVGTGVGGAVVRHGRIVRGATGATPELGETYIGLDLDAGAPLHRPRPPVPGTVEHLASGRALERLGAERGFADAKEVVRAAGEGDSTGAEVLRTIGERLGIAIANAINTFDPDLVVVGGGVPLASELVFDAARDTALRFALHEAGLHPEIRLARHGAVAGARGAALLAASRADGRASG